MSTQLQPFYLPNELWFFILKSAVSSAEWDGTVFFPPADDFALINGFKGACSTFRALVDALHETLRDRSVCLADSSKLLRQGNFSFDRVRHIMIKRNTTLADYLIFMPNCPKLTSLSLSFSQREFAFLGLQTVLVSQTLVRLDLSYADVFWRGLALDFPNLQELRLSSMKPHERHDEPKFVPIVCIGGDRFATELINSLRKLQRLKYLSVHITLDNMSALDGIRINHLDRHKCASTVHFTQCKFCERVYETRHSTVLREAKLSSMLAEKLPALECVLWTDAWNESFYDDKAQRKSEILRGDDGKISVKVDGEKVRIMKKFTMTRN